MTAPLTDLRQIARIADGIIASKALFAALNRGRFDHGAKGIKDLSGLSSPTGVAENRLAALLAAQGQPDVPAAH